VCGGIAEYFAIDPSLVRIVAVVLLLIGPLGGMTFLGYVVLWIVLPESSTPPVARTDTQRDVGETGLIIGIGLLALGAWLLVGRLSWMGWGMMGWGTGWMQRGWSPGFVAGPLLLIAIGLVVVMWSRRQRP